jgi:hypothetical protein
VEETAIWLGSVAEWATVVAASAAVALTIWGFRKARRATQRSDLVRIHERLMSLDLQRGRRLLADAHASGESLEDIRRKRPEDWDQINLAVSSFQMLAELARTEVVRLDDAVELWGGSLTRFEPFIIARRALDRHRGAWGDLVWFAIECGAEVTITVTGEPASAVAVRLSHKEKRATRARARRGKK